MPIAVLKHSWALIREDLISMNIYPYVYRLDHPVTGEFYIGYRSANKVPAEQDLGQKYFTSSKVVKPRFNEFQITIVAEFFCAESAWDFEQELIFESWESNRVSSLNLSCYFNSKKKFLPPKVLSEEHKRKIGNSNKGRPKASRKPISEETRNKMRLARIKIMSIPRPPISEETRNKMRLSHLEYWRKRKLNN